MENRNSNTVLLVLCLAKLMLVTVEAEVPAIFVLGDSTVDVGTNNFLPGTKPKANFPPYGIDFPHSRPTGRFSNGFNTADALAKRFGFKRSPPPYFFLANNPNILKRTSFRGVNFASGGAGILDTTAESSVMDDLGRKSTNQNHVVSLRHQIEQMSIVHGNLTAAQGRENAETLISKSLLIISVGSNDIFAYFMSKTKRTISKQQFISSLVLAYQNHLKNLLKIGARKLGVISVPPIGCCPSLRVYNTSASGGCAEELNELARDFYSAINVSMVNLSSEYKDLKFSIGNTVEMTTFAITYHFLFGFTDVKNACCGGNQTGKGPSICNSTSSLCSDRDQYLFWDRVHPTQAASDVAAATLYSSGLPQFVAPINFFQLGDA